MKNMTSVLYSIYLLIISITIVITKPCDILENMSCDCHSSIHNETEQLACTNYYIPLNNSIQLTNNSLENPRSFDSFHLTFHTREFNITPMFLNQLSYLFPRSSPGGRQFQRKLKIILTFQDYIQLHFEDYSFYQIFGEKSDYTTSLSLELTSSGQITFAPMAFNQLTVDQMSLHSSSLEPYSFEEIFNNTKIGSLNIEGKSFQEQSIRKYGFFGLGCTPRSNNTLKRYFNGKIRSAKFTKMAEIVSSEEFAQYPVNSMIIEAHEPRKMNASTFMNYKNLNGVHLVRPKFFFDNRSFDGFQYLPNLETLELDAETIKDNTFQHVTRIRFFTLGQNVRYLSEHSFDHLDYLTRFDASKVILDQLYPSSKCILARYLQKQQKINPAMIILPPQAEFCDCVYDFILNMVNKKPEQSYVDLCQNTQQERCQLSECDVVRNFRLPIKDNKINQHIIPSIDESGVDPSIFLYPANDPATSSQRPPSYIPRRPPVYHGSQTHNNNNNNNNNDEDESIGSSFADTQDLHASSLKANKPIDPNAIPTDDVDENINSPSSIQNSDSLTDEHHRIIKKNQTLKWISFSLLGLTMLSIILVSALIWFFTCRRSKPYNKAGFQRVPPNGSTV